MAFYVAVQFLRNANIACPANASLVFPPDLGRATQVVRKIARVVTEGTEVVRIENLPRQGVRLPTVTGASRPTSR